MEPTLLTSIIILGIFGGYMLINLASFWRKLEEIKERNEQQDRLKGRYSGYSGLGGLTALLRTERGKKKYIRRT
jgi:hypothetical protein